MGSIPAIPCILAPLPSQRLKASAGLCSNRRFDRGTSRSVSGRCHGAVLDARHGSESIRCRQHVVAGRIPVSAGLRKCLFRSQGGELGHPQRAGTMTESESWDSWIEAGLPDEPPPPREAMWRRLLRRVMPTAAKRIKRMFDWLTVKSGPTLLLPLDWMPAAGYQRYWHWMPAFALPSFYDGRVRINLRGREASGIVIPADYQNFAMTWLPRSGYAAIPSAVRAGA